MNDNDDEELIFTVNQKSSGQRIDRFLTTQIYNQSRSQIQKAIENKRVSVNNKTVTKNFVISVYDVITVRNPYHTGTISEIEPQNIRINVKFEDEYFLVVSKSAGITVHPAPGNPDKTLANAVIFYLKKNRQEGLDVKRAGIVHRLDKDTSGLIIIAKNESIARKISEQFKSRTVEKEYTALVLGYFIEKKGEIRLPVGRSRLDRKKMGISIDKGREAVTGFSVIEEFDGCTMIQVYPKTGRTHQIRVHFSYIGHPVIGDKRYGNKESEVIARNIGLERQFLHASKLKFIHPVNGRVMEFKDGLADDLVNALNNLKIKKSKEKLMEKSKKRKD